MAQSLLSRATGFARERGLRQLPARLLRELSSPSTALGHRLRGIVRAPRIGLALARRREGLFAEPNSLVAFYDCQILPITYDFCWFAVAAELMRRQRGFDSLRFVIVGGKSWSSGPESAHYLSIVDGEERQQRIINILVPIAGLLPAQDSITVLSSRQLASRLADTCYGRTFPEHYFPQFPGPDRPFAGLVCDAARNGISIPSLRAPIAASQRLREWREHVCSGRPVVTITIRHSPYLPLRNSNLNAWTTVARQLAQRGYLVAIVPDTAQTLKGLPPQFEGAVVMPEASWNVALRAALYEQAFVNLGVSCGPMALCWLNADCRHITFKLNVDGEPATSAEFHKSIGIDPQDPFPFSGPFQRVLTAPDDADVITREFDRFIADLEDHKRAS